MGVHERLASGPLTSPFCKISLHLCLIKLDMSAVPPPPPQGSNTAAPRKKSRSGPIAAVVVVVIIVVLLAGLYTARVGPFAPASSKGGPSYTVTFSENGLPTGASWTVTLAGSKQSSFGAILFSEKNGTYSFAIFAMSGYTASPQNGTVTVNGGPVSETITFANTSSKPLQTVFGWGSPVNATGETMTGCPSAVGRYCYLIVMTAGLGVSTSNIQLSLRAASGATIAWPAGVTISLLSPTVRGAVATYSSTTNLWTLNGTFSGALASGMTIVIYTAGTGAANGLFGSGIEATGVNGYTGSVWSSPFT